MAVIDDSRDALSLSQPTAGPAEVRRVQAHADGSPWDRVLLVVTWVVVLALIAAPIIYIVIAAFSKNPSQIGSALTLGSVKKVYASGSTLWLLVRSIGFALLVSGLATLIATGLAWTTVRLQMRGARLREALFLGPLFIPPFVVTVAWIWLCTPNNGLVDNWLRKLSVTSWIQPNVLSTAGIVFVLVIQFIPFAYLFVAGAIRRLDGRMEEASLLCGRGLTYTSFRITARMLRPSLLSAVLFLSILTLGEYTVPVLLDQNGAFAPLAVTVYNALFGSSESLQIAAAVSSQLMIVCLVGLWLYRRTLRDTAQFVSVSGRGHQEQKIAVSRPTAVIVWIGTVLYGVLTFFMPFVALLIMAASTYVAPSLSEMSLSWHNVWSVLDTDAIRTATINTVILSAVVPLVAVTIGTSIVYLADRVHMRTARALTYIATAPLAVPGLVMATGFMLIFIRTSLYGGLPLIGLGLVAVTITHAVRIIGNGMQQVDPSLEEASQVCGVSRLKTLRLILVPLIRPSVFSSFILVFALSSRELNMPLTLYSPKSDVLPLMAWSAAQSTVTQAAAIGLLQIALMLFGLLILNLLFKTKRSIS